jgi:hypothetical protein
MSIPYIVQNIFGGDPDRQRCRYSNGLTARAHGIDTWDHIRLAFRISATNFATTVTGTARLVFGFCHGQTAVPGDLLADNFVGFRSAVAIWNYYASTPSCLQLDGHLVATQKVGANYADQVTGYMSNMTLPDATAECRTAVMIDLVRDGGGLFTLKSKLVRAQHADMTDADYNTFLDQAIVTDPAMTGHSTNLGADYQFTIDEGLYGAIDSVCFMWDRTQPFIDVSDVLVARLA